LIHFASLLLTVRQWTEEGETQWPAEVWAILGG